MLLYHHHWMSTTAVELTSGSHEFKIMSYSSCQDIGTGKWITSRPFMVGGHQWCLRFYPDGDSLETADHVAVYLELVNATTGRVNALFDIRFLDAVNGAFCAGTPENMRPCEFAPNGMMGFDKFMLKTEMEALGCLRHDCLTIRCNVIVVNDVDVNVLAAADAIAKASINEPDD